MTRDPLVNTAQNLTEIVHLYADLRTQAIHKANARELPGGRAMIALAPVANREAWENMQATTERTGRHYTAPELEDDEDTPLETIAFWSERWRKALGAEYDGQIHSILTEVNFLKWNLDWATRNEAEWERFVDDIHGVRSRLESILKDGQRDLVSDEVSCLLCETPLRRRMTDRDGYEDEWWCRDCGVHLTSAQFNLAASEAARRAVGLA